MTNHGTGFLLWFDNSKDPMTDKVRKALDAHIQKFGVPANIVETSLKDEPVPEGVELVVRVQRVRIPKSHFLIGVE